jgi:ribosomal protein S18 acetylase RimI-like enzyme
MLKTYWHMALAIASGSVSDVAPPGIEIRALSGSRDIESIALLYAVAFDDAQWSPDWTGFPGYDSRGVFLAWDGDGLVGYVVSYVLPKSKEAYISVVATAPAHRRRGIASALIARAVKRFHLQGFEQVTIDVAADNEPALRAYQSLGFARVGEFLADEHCRIPETAQDGPS